MASININTFTSYKQTPEEELVGMCMCTEQRQFLQNQISRIAEEILALTPDPINYSVFIQQEAYLKGQLDFAKYLLDCAIQAEPQQLEAAQNQQ